MALYVMHNWRKLITAIYAVMAHTLIDTFHIYELEATSEMMYFIELNDVNLLYPRMRGGHFFSSS